MRNLSRKILRIVTGPFFRFSRKQTWKVLRLYPHVVPTDVLLDSWQRSEWPEYKRWLDRHSILTKQQWLAEHRAARKVPPAARITIVTPVYNTDPQILEECILSVRLQTSPYWELVLSDDGSTKPETLAVLRSRICRDPRIRILPAKKKAPSGISAATNRAIKAATGDYIIFLDHDDRLAPEAIHSVLSAIAEDPGRDIIYSDRDMISPGGKRFMHLMKPDWSPDNLYAGNYIFHLMCYRRSLINRVGGLRSEYDGSQDYDLILRCMEHDPEVHHIPKVLYHWRQHDESVALHDDSKSYAFEAGMEALRDALRRRGIKGATVTENKSLWRGNYQVHLPLPPAEDIGHIILNSDLPPDQYVSAISDHPVWNSPPPFIFIRQEDCLPDHYDAPRILASWLKMEQIGMSTGRVLSKNKKIIYAGMHFDEKGNLYAPYSGFNADEPGYIAVTKNIRNIRPPLPFCVVIRSEALLQAGGFSKQFLGPYALLDLAMRIIQLNWRILYVPHATFTSPSRSMTSPPQWTEQNKFYRQWKKQLEPGDPFYNHNLRKNSTNYELA